jgi:hypothetical protein
VGEQEVRERAYAHRLNRWRCSASFDSEILKTGTVGRGAIGAAGRRNNRVPARLRGVPKPRRRHTGRAAHGPRWTGLLRDAADFEDRRPGPSRPLSAYARFLVFSALTGLTGKVMSGRRPL